MLDEVAPGKVLLLCRSRAKVQALEEALRLRSGFPLGLVEAVVDLSGGPGAAGRQAQSARSAAAKAGPRACASPTRTSPACGRTSSSAPAN